MAENRKGEEGDGSLGGGGVGSFSSSSSSSSSTLTVPSVRIDIPADATENVQSGWRLGRQIHRMPIQLRLMQPKQQYVYDPVTVSIGPYHHGKPHLHQLEEFKRFTLESFLSDSEGGRNREFFYTKIYEQIDEIRNCYVGVSENEYDDAALSDMMLHDASFIIYYMTATYDETVLAQMINHLGILTAFLAGSDLDMLENQIPYWVIKFLMRSKFGEDEWKAVLRKNLSNTCFDDFDTLTTIPWEEGEGDDQKDPLHLLEASQRILVRLEQQSSDVPTTSCSFLTEISSQIFKIFDQYICNRCWKKKEDNVDYKILSRQFHSATYLKTKGIHFRPSSNSMQDVRFKSHSLYGKLLLPIRFVNTENRVWLPNLIAFELSPKINILNVPPHVTSYINFMKRLIENPKDVKELREQGILFSNLASDEEVVKLFQEIDTMGVHIDFFDDVKMSIKEHCKYKSKTWIAELINYKFRSPWTVTALLAATVLLILTFLQTFYTIRAA